MRKKAEWRFPRLGEGIKRELLCSGYRVYVEDDEKPSPAILATDSDDGYKAL